MLTVSLIFWLMLAKFQKTDLSDIFYGLGTHNQHMWECTKNGINHSALFSAPLSQLGQEKHTTRTKNHTEKYVLLL